MGWNHQLRQFMCGPLPSKKTTTSADEMMRFVPNKKRQEEHVFDRFKSTSNVHSASVGWKKISAGRMILKGFNPF